MRRPLAMKIGVLTVVIAATAAVFQNCGGNSGFQANTVGLNSQANSNSPSPGSNPPTILTLITAQDQIQPGLPFTMIANQSGLPAGTTYLWDHDFSDGLIYCDATTSLDGSTSTVVCPENGISMNTLTVTLPNGTQQIYTMNVTVGLAPVTIPTPQPSTTPNPTPTIPVTVAENTYSYLSTNLFGQQCTVCHFAGNFQNIPEFETYSAIINATYSGQKVLVPGSANTSPIYTQITGGLMPQGSPSFAVQNPALVTALQSWINAGALNN